ncbi:3'(2'),5'-bisphosphate nucleotidase CysQ [Rugosimonospora acidiphila]|uniref:3'(2'),5'-bisphosphate nucleotidase CysQ n=1 Tax=Rugosimonospora acidiphila TaxID=556531 RepID=A0ABP9SAA7_9ACTN
MPPAVDGAFARWLAEQAGQALMELRADERYRDDPDALRAAGDKQSHDLITAMLARWRPGDEVLSEEGVRDDPARLDAERVWIVDPLDGTREFGEPGRVDWAVHIGLWSRGSAAPSRLSAAAVALPAQHRVFGTDFPPGYPPMSASAAQAGPSGTGEGPDGSGTGRLRIAASRTRPPAVLQRVADELGATIVPMGSAGAKIIAVVTGDVDAYVHAGGQYEWDSAAPVAVATATGLHASRIDGSALEYNQADPKLPDLVVCRKDLASRLLAALRSPQ